MLLQAGQLFCSHSVSPDDYFHDAVVFIAEHNTQGSLGFIVNRLFPRRLNELSEFSRLPPFAFYEGGPVDEEHLYFLHRRPDLVEGSTQVLPGVYFGGDFKQAVKAIEERTITDTDIRLFIGYCGWDAGELEREWKEGGWEETDFVVFP